MIDIVMITSGRSAIVLVSYFKFASWQHHIVADLKNKSDLVLGRNGLSDWQIISSDQSSDRTGIRPDSKTYHD